MTIGEMVEKFSTEMAEEAVKDKEKGKIIEELNEIMDSAAEGYKIDGCKLFDICHRLNIAFPEYTSALIAMSFIAAIGIKDDLVDFGDVTGLDIDDVVTGAEIDGREE